MFVLGAKMRFLVKILFVLVGSLFAGGCAILDQELNNRGGYFDYLADKYWFKADTRGMRLLRGYVLEASLARIGSVSSKTTDDRSLIQLRIANATKNAADIYQCIQKEGATPPVVCVFFDDLMVQYEDSLLALARSALTFEEGKDLLARVMSGGIGTIEAIFDFSREAFIFGRRAAALYRGSIELEMIVAIDYFDSHGRSDISQPLKDVYRQGAGDLRLWKATLAQLKASYFGLIWPGPQHYDAVTEVIKRACDQIGGAFTDQCKRNITTPPDQNVASVQQLKTILKTTTFRAPASLRPPAVRMFRGF